MARTATKKKTTVKKKSVVKVKMAKKPPAAKKPAQKSVAKSKSVLDVGSAAPSFSLPAIGSGIEGGKISSASLKGKPYVIYFYPKDDTSGCTAEACGFRDSIAAFNKLGIKLVGVSRDNLVSHEKFAKKYQLNFPLASDEQGELCASYGVWVKKSMYGRTYMGIERSTFLIDGKGTICAVWRKVNVPGHIEEVRKAASGL